MPAYYNEIDKYAAEWLRNLIAAGHIAPGDVDERSIEDVRPDDLKSYTQCHFFAGIAGWSHALRLAGWSDDRPVWTGSCPCQPFSAAGKGAGITDERHLWPAFFHLINQCRPSIIFGEQVASKAGLGWFDLVSADLEGSGYAVGANDICAAGIGAPHIRQRLWFVAEAKRVANAAGSRCEPRTRDTGIRGQDTSQESAAEQRGAQGALGRVADADSAGSQPGREAASPMGYRDTSFADGSGDWPRPTDGFWRDTDWLFCRDGKWRPVEPGTFPLAHGATSRMGRLRAYGNAIVPQVAAEFVRCALIRTSPKGKGQKFVGTCTKCGTKDLPGSAVHEPCPQDDIVSDEVALLQILKNE